MYDKVIHLFPLSKILREKKLGKAQNSANNLTMKFF